MAFKNINYRVMLFETLRKFFSVNSNNAISVLFTFLTAFVQLFEVPFANFVTFRNKEQLIAQCKWQVGQLANVLNILYDSTLKRIYCTQSTYNIAVSETFDYDASTFDSDFGSAPLIYENEFNDKVATTQFIINVPTDVYNGDLVATVNQIAFTGANFTINQF
jgi:hypothetical protein